MPYLRPRWDFLSVDDEGTLLIERIPASDLARRYGTPLQIIVESKLRDQLRRFKAAFPYPSFRPQYACKCNSNLDVMRIVREEGFDIDASSAGEIMAARLAGFEPERIMLTSVHKSDADLAFAAKVGVRAITIDSMEELDRALSSPHRVRMFLRFHMPCESGADDTPAQQSGIDLRDAERAIRKAAKRLAGFHFHGGYVRDPGVYARAAARLLDLAVWARDSCGVTIEALDLGGGFPFEHKDEVPFSPESMGAGFITQLRSGLRERGLPDITLIFEPGKYIVGNAGISLMRVVSRKQRGGKVKLIVDGSAYSQLPDSLIYKQFCEVIPATRMRAQASETVDVCGSSCDCIDRIASGRALPSLREGDMIAVMDSGAYNSMIASNFNSLRRPPLVLVSPDGSTRVIRRRDTYSGLFASVIADPADLRALEKLWSETL